MAKNKLDSALNQVLETVNKLDNAWDDFDKKILSSSQNIRKLGKTNLSGFLPKEVNDRIQKNVKFTEQMEKQIKNVRLEEIELQKAREKAFDDYEKQLEKERKARERQVKKESQLRQSLAKQKEREYKAEVRQAEKASKSDARQQYNQRIIARNAREYAVISSKLSTEYEKQGVILVQLTRKYQDLSIKKKQGIKLTKEEEKEYEELGRDIKKLDKNLKDVDKEVGRHQRNVGNYGSAWGNVGGIMRSAIAAFGVYSAMDIGRQIINQIKEIDGLDKALLKVTETQEDFNDSLVFLQDLADRSGIKINTLESAYTKFFASAKNTNLTLGQIREIFDSVAMAGASLNLSTEDVTGAFRALEQMLSKGKVQAEEIRGQLGERLPGSFQILAESMGVTTAQLDKMLEQGQVIADEVLPNFAKQLQITFSLDNAQKIETLNAAQGRLSNSWNRFVRTLSDSQGTISKVLIGVYGGLEKIAGVLTKLNETVDDRAQKNYNEVLKEQLDYYESIGAERAKQAAEYDQSLALGQMNEIEAKITTLKEEQKLIKENHKWYSGLTKLMSGGLLGESSDSEKLYANQKAIEQLTVQLERERARRNAAARQIIDHTDWLSQNTDEENENADAIDDTNKKLKERKDIEVTSEIRSGNVEIKKSIGYFEDLISKAEEAKSSISDPVAYKALEDNIAQLKEKIEEIKGNSGSFEGISIDIGASMQTDMFFKNMNFLSETLGQSKESLISEFIDLYGKDFSKFKEFSEKKMSQANLENEYKKEKLLDWMQFSADAVSEIGNLAMAFSERKIQKYEEEIQANNEMYNNWLENENLTEAERKQWEKERQQREEELQKKKAKEQEKQAKIAKATAALTIAINTAAAIIGALAPPPVGLGPVAGIPFSIQAGVMGALQLATVLAQPIPKYKKGRKGGKAEIAEVGDGGVSEVVTDRQGKFKYITPNKPTYTFLEQGDNVISSVPEYLEGMTLDKLNQAAIMTSLQSQARALNDKQTANEFRAQLLGLKEEIKAGFKNVTINNHTNNDRLAAQIASELQFSKRRDV